MIRFYSVFVLFTMACLPGAAQETFSTGVATNLVKTLQVRVGGQMMSNPIIDLNGEQAIEINFDAIDPGYKRFAYSVIHCDANWQQSLLSPIEYLDGFQGLVVDDFATSIGTTTQYTNYRLLLPNDDVRLKVSGNYAVRFYYEDDPQRTLFTACFSVSEGLVGIDASVSGNTMVDVNREHQQVSFTINHPNLPIRTPQSDLKLVVSQNNRRDNAVTNLTPTSILTNRLVYEYNRNLVFKAGNEFRRMEFLSNRYNGMGVRDIQFHNPYYHVDLLPDRPRNAIPYQYDQDQNGRFFIRCSSCDDPDTESDYYIVHFTLAADRLPGGDLYLFGNLFNNRLDESSRMGYNAESGCYEKAVLLKQGSYNYQYLFLPTGSTRAETAPAEGDYYQAENEYTLFVYYRPMGERYDRLIGTTTIRNTMRVL